MKKVNAGSVKYGRKRIKYIIIRRPRRKTVTIAVDPIDGVILYAPEKARYRRLAKITFDKAPWIIKKLQQFSEVTLALTAREYVSGESFLYLGRHYRLRVVRVGKKQEPSIKGWRGRFIVKVDRNLDEEERRKQVRSLLIEWYQEHAKERIPERTEVYARKLGVTVPNILIRNQRKRWGSCDTKGNIRLNWHIVMAPMSLVDYVVAHELCHLKYQDHSAAFWKSMRILMPDFETRRERLRKGGTKYIL